MPTQMTHQAKTPFKNGCHNRLPLGGQTYPVQDGWADQLFMGETTTRMPIIRQHENVGLSTDCQYSQRTTDDPGCADCIRKWAPATLLETA